jgi:hypothetical protein
MWVETWLQNRRDVLGLLKFIKKLDRKNLELLKNSAIWQNL